MENGTKRILLGLALTGALGLAHPTSGAIAGEGAEAGDETPPASAEMTDEMEAMHAAMMERHREMMEKRQAEVEAMEARKARLDELVAAMEAAEGPEKTEALVDVVEELVAQHRAMMYKRLEMMETGHHGMTGMSGMGHHGMAMGHHGAKGPMHGMNHGASCCEHHGDAGDCPMMRGGETGHGMDDHPGDESPNRKE